MRSASIIEGLFVAIAIVLLTGAPAKATTYNEGISGDLSNSQGAPTPLTLTLGSNAIIGANGGADTQDWVSFTIPAGFIMTSFVNAAYSSADAQGFTGFQLGSAFIGSPFTQGSYTGYAHFGTGATNPTTPASTVGVDLLPFMANPTVAAGAIGFTPPLGAGTYTFLIQQLGGTTTYEFDMNVSPVPESASVWLFGVGTLGVLALLRRKRAS